MAPRFCMTIVYMLIGTAAIVGLDQASKLLIVSTMSIGQTIPVIDGFFSITYIENTGAAFGLFSGNTGILAAVTVAMMLAGIIFAATKADELGKFVLMNLVLIMGGGIGNLLDRIFRGYVVDFLDFKVWNPIFNVADIFVCTGCGLIIIYLLFLDGKKNGKSN